MKCPICKKQVAMSDPFMPFCSERCKLIDLGKWADEDYRIPGPAVEVPKREESAEDRDSDE